MLDTMSYEEVCENLGLCSYQDQEHEDNESRLYGDDELVVIMSEIIGDLMRAKQ